MEGHRKLPHCLKGLSITLEDKMHTLCLRVLLRAEDLDSVSASCREAGISRTVFYR